MLGRLLIAVIAIAATSSVANATPFLGTDTFADTTSGSPLSLTATYDLNPISFNIGPGQSFSTPDLLTLSAVNSGGAGNNNIQVNFDFTRPGRGTGTVNGTGVGTIFSIYGFEFNAGVIAWNPSAISFPDGTLLDVSLGNATFSGFGGSGTATISAAFTLVNAPGSDPPAPVREPGSLALLGTGLFGLWLLTGVKKKI